MFILIGVHTFKKWVNLNVARFKFDNTNSKKNWLTIEYPKEYSEKIQCTDFGMHVPVTISEGIVQWHCFPSFDEESQKELKRRKIEIKTSEN